MKILSFENFLSAVCDDISIQRVRKRVRTELSDHMETALEDCLAEGMEEEAARARVLAEMGDPETLHRELRRAYRPMLYRIRFQRLAGLVALYFFCMYVLIPIADELKIYHYSYSLEDAESILSNKLGNGTELLLVDEVEYNGRMYRYYVPKNQTQSCYQVYSIQSVRVFGHELQDRFAGFDCQYSDGSFFMDDLYLSEQYEARKHADYSVLQWQSHVPDEKMMVVFFTDAQQVRYFKTQFLPGRSDGYPNHTAEPVGESPYYEVTATPCLLAVEYPTDMCFGEMQFLDENRNGVPMSGGTYGGRTSIG